MEEYYNSEFAKDVESLAEKMSDKELADVIKRLEIDLGITKAHKAENSKRKRILKFGENVIILVGGVIAFISPLFDGTLKSVLFGLGIGFVSGGILGKLYLSNSKDEELDEYSQFQRDVYDLLKDHQKRRLDGREIFPDVLG